METCPSLNRQGRTSPVEVTRKRLHVSQKCLETADITPIRCPEAEFT
jgi:hypothetical protein